MVTELNETLGSEEDPFLRQSAILSAKHRLYDICFQEAVAFASSATPEFGWV